MNPSDTRSPATAGTASAAAPAAGQRPTILLHPSGNPTGKPATPYLLNCWYAAALSREIPAEGLFSRQLLDTRVLMYRLADGSPVALHDRCPHRFVPLSMGKRCGDEVRCAYHALQFNGQGQCTHNPHGNQHIPTAAKVRSFPLLERHGFVWIWMGDQPADPTKLADHSALDEGPASAIAWTYMPMQANYELIIDNVMDLSHVDHVHGEIISTRGQLSPIIPPVSERDGAITVRWEWQQQPPMGIFAPFMAEPAAPARHFLNVTWHAPASIQLSVGANQDGGPMDLAHTTGQYDLHTCTPASEGQTHYFFVTRRNHVVDDEGFNAFKIKAMHDAFVNEDGPIIEAVHNEMGTTDFFALNPVLISSDAAPVRVRRRLAQMIAQEGRYK